MPAKDLVFRFLGVDAGAGREFDRMAGKASKTAGEITKFTLGFVAAGATVAVESVRMAAKFQTSMEVIHTQAGASQREVTKMSKAILALSGPVATAPDELAKGLYHLESSGLRGAKALEALKAAAEGAKIGGADLESVTNALNAVIASGISGAKNMNQAMGALNATVGAGDMRMQDLADAMSTGVLTVAKNFGVSLTDVGAALAVFGDNNIRGADAATKLSQAITYLEKPAKGADKVLKTIGLSSRELRADMGKGGLGLVLTDLHDKLTAAGDTGTKVGPILLDAFGRKPAGAINTLLGQFNRFQLKQEEVQRGSKNFASDWKAYTETFGYSWDRAKAAFQSMVIQLGQELLPTATKVMNWLGTTGVQDVHKLAVELGHVGSWVKDNSGWLKPLAEGIAGLAVAYKALKLAQGIGATLGKIPGISKVAGELGVQKVYVVNMPPGGIGPGGGGPVKTAEKDAETVAKTGAAATFLRYAKDFAKSPIKGGGLALTGATLTDRYHGNPLSGFYPQQFARGINSLPVSKRLAAAQDYLQTTGLSKPLGSLDALKKFQSNPAEMAAVDGWLKKWGLDINGVAASAKQSANDIDNEKTSLAALRAEIVRHATAVGGAVAGIKKIPGAYAQLVAQAKAEGVSIGAALDAGLTIGITQNGGKVNLVSKQLVGGVLHTMHNTAQLGSPSKITTQYGRWLAEGLAVGYTGEAAKVLAQFSKSTDKMLLSIGGQAQSAIGKYQSDLAARTSFRQGLQQSLAGAGDLGGATVFGGNSGPQGGARGFLTSQAGALRTLAVSLGKLRKLGLSPVLLAQIANAGPQQGVLLAQEILSGADGSIRSLNRIESSIQTYANTAAGTVANAQFGRTLTHDLTAIATLAKSVEHLASKSGRWNAADMHTFASVLAQELSRILKIPLSDIDKALGIRSWAGS